MILAMCTALGARVITICTVFGNFTLFCATIFATLFTSRLKIRKLFTQMNSIGVDSWIIVILTGFCAGAVLAIQSYIAFKRFGGQELMGPLIALSMTRELGPVLTGLMVAGRCGSAIAAEIGTMRITEQIDALQTLLINPFQYLIVPRVLASTIILPFLTLFSSACGIIGGYLVSVNVLGLNGEQYVAGIASHVELNDIIGGLIKAGAFGLILALVGSYKGFLTRGGSRGVGQSTTQSVVIGSILILIANYFLASLLFG